MNPAPEPQPRQRRYSVRQQVRFDTETHAKLEALANLFHRKRAQILRHVMQWGCAHTQEWTVDPSIPDRPHLVHIPDIPHPPCDFYEYLTSYNHLEGCPRRRSQCCWSAVRLRRIGHGPA